MRCRCTLPAHMVDRIDCAPSRSRKQVDNGGSRSVGCVRAVVKLQSLAIKSAAAEGRAPRRVKLFINRASLGFSEAADFAPVQVRRRACLVPVGSLRPSLVVQLCDL